MLDPEDLRTDSLMIFGNPAPQSGIRIVPTGAGPRAISTGGTDLETWRQAIAREAEIKRVEGKRHLGPVSLDVEFRYPMPQSRLVRQKRQGSIPKVTQPDLDKLLRAVGDALTVGGLIVDDAQICEIHATKWEWLDSWTGAAISVRDLWTP